MDEEFIKEIAEKLPVDEIYKDGLKSTTQEVGKISSDLLKCLHLALAPIQIGAAYQDRFRNFIDNSIRKVPEDKQISPPPQIAGPLLEGIRYEPEGTELFKMAESLLATSMHKDRVNEAHPSFPSLLKELSRDEAFIIKLLSLNDYYRIYEADLIEEANEFGVNNIKFTNFNTIEDNFPKDKLYFPENLDFYIEHLYNLGLAAIYKTDTISLPIGQIQTGTREKEVYRLTNFGKKFANACGF